VKSRFVLASRSPRRYELLKPLGFEIDIVPSRIEENLIVGESPEDHVLRLAEAKASEVGSRFPNRWVIAADTIVYIDHSILGKPKTQGEAIEMLQILSGREHWVLTGFSVQNIEKGKKGREAIKTAVKMKPLSPVEIDWYVNTKEPFDKAGGYAIQGIGSFMVESIRGSYTNVIGLPLCELMEMLVRLGAISISGNGLRILD
jgi:septum formation protein